MRGGRDVLAVQGTLLHQRGLGKTKHAGKEGGCVLMSVSAFDDACCRAGGAASDACPQRACVAFHALFCHKGVLGY